MKEKETKEKRKIPVFIYYIVFAVIILLVSTVIIPQLNAPTYKEISYNEFLKMLDEGKIAKVNISSNIIIETKDFKETKVYYQTGYLQILDLDLKSKLDAAGVDYKSPIQTSTTVWEVLLNLLPIVLIVVMFIIVFRMMNKKLGGSVMSFGKSTGKIYAEQSTGKTFEDVAGQDEAKQSLVEIIDFLNHPEKYTAIGAKLPKGALLVGPPGTGKTLLAKAVAGEAKVPFLSLSGSEFIEMFVGVGASRVRDLFKQAVENAPCIIFIDEVDAIGKSRDNAINSNDEREQTLNQLLAEMDGFDSSKGVVILAATNRPEVLDKALLRPGRFDRRIIVDLPDQLGRVAILKVHARTVIMDESIDFDIVARATPGASGADLANIINEAALRAVRVGKSKVTQKELDEAIEVIIAGEQKKNKVMSEEEKRIVSYHETGHALTTAILTHTQPVHKITIIPRTSGTLGYVMQVAKKEKVLYTKKELLDEITVMTGGRAAEEIVFDSVTTGASNDIEKATTMARNMVTSYGMSDEFGFVNWESSTSRYLLDNKTINCSDDTESKIDKAIQSIISSAYKKAVDILSDHKGTLDTLAQVLFDRESITGEEFVELLKKCEPSFADIGSVSNEGV